MPRSLEETDWGLLLRRINSGKCTPFLGAGACFGALPLGADIAREWAEEWGYPLPDSNDLARVAQFLAVKFQDAAEPKERMCDRLEGAAPPDFSQPDEPHGVMADLPLPVYMTTNYDSFMVQALEHANKKPQRELCRWNSSIQDEPSIFNRDSAFQPHPATPVVFHLHGHKDVVDSLVLTHDDYLDFLVNVAKDEALLPGVIQKAMAGASLLFIVYSLEDWSFQVLFRGLVSSREASLRRLSVAVQLLPEGPESTREEMENYLDKYFNNMNIRVFWGTAREFCAELRQRWSQFSDGT